MEGGLTGGGSGRAATTQDSLHTREAVEDTTKADRVPSSPPNRSIRPQAACRADGSCTGHPPTSSSNYHRRHPRLMAPDTELSGICAYFCVRGRPPATTASKVTRVPRTKEELTNPDTTPPAPPTSSSPELHNTRPSRADDIRAGQTTTTPLRATLRALQASPTSPRKSEKPQLAGPAAAQKNWATTRARAWKHSAWSGP